MSDLEVILPIERGVDGRLDVIPPHRTRARLIYEARRNIGARFVHQARIAGPNGAMDCAGEVSMPGRAAGFEIPDRLDYDRYSAGTAMPEQLAKFADRIEIADARLADLLTFWRRKRGAEEHVGWFVPSSRIVHAWIKGGVCEVEIGSFWGERLVGAWRIRGIV